MKLSNIVERIVEKAFPTGGGGLLSSWFLPGKVSRRDLLKRYEGYVYASVRPIAQAVSKIEFEVQKTAPDGTKVALQKHSFLDLMNRPNPDMTKNQFLAQAWTHKKVAGETFFYVLRGEATGYPKQLHILRPDLMEVAVGRDDNNMPTVLGYIYHKEENGERIPLDRDEVIHIYEPNPMNPFRGLGAVEAGILYVMTEKYGAEFTRNYIANNASPAGILNIDGTIDGEEWKKLKRQFNNEYATAANAGKTFFLKNSKVNFVKVGSNLSDIDLKALKEMTRDDIMAMFGVSKPILGILDDVNLASAKTAKYVFTSEIVDPEMDMLCDALEVELVRWNPDYCLDHESPIPLDEETELREIKEGVNVYLTIDEARAKRGLPPLPDGSGAVLYLPLNMVPVSSLAAPAPAKAAKALEGSQVRIEKKKMMGASLR